MNLNLDESLLGPVLGALGGAGGVSAWLKFRVDHGAQVQALTLATLEQLRADVVTLKAEAAAQGEKLAAQGRALIECERERERDRMLAEVQAAARKVEDDRTQAELASLRQQLAVVTRHVMAASDGARTGDPGAGQGEATASATVTATTSGDPLGRTA